MRGLDWLSWRRRDQSVSLPQNCFQKNKKPGVLVRPFSIDLAAFRGLGGTRDFYPDTCRGLKGPQISGVGGGCNFFFQQRPCKTALARPLLSSTPESWSITNFNASSKGSFQYGFETNVEKKLISPLLNRLLFPRT